MEIDSQASATSGNGWPGHACRPLRQSWSRRRGGGAGREDEGRRGEGEGKRRKDFENQMGKKLSRPPAERRGFRGPWNGFGIGLVGSRPALTLPSRLTSKISAVRLGQSQLLALRSFCCETSP